MRRIPRKELGKQMWERENPRYQVSGKGRTLSIDPPSGKNPTRFRRRSKTVKLMKVVEEAQLETDSESERDGYIKVSSKCEVPSGFLANWAISCDCQV